MPPSGPFFAFLDHPGPIAYAHRGGSAERPENSMAAFHNAVGLGFRYLETDARLTADGHLVALHDDRLDRVSDGSGLIADLSLTEVQQARLIGPQGELTNERVPLVSEILETFLDQRVNLDAKEDRAVGPLGDLIASMNAVERVCIGAFSSRRIAQLRTRLGPRLCTVLGPTEVGLLRAASYGIPVWGIQGAVAQVPVSNPVGLGVRLPIVDRRFVATATKRSIHTHVWTVDRPAEINRLLDLGVSGIMTDRPTTLKQTLVARGDWVA